MHKIKVNSVSGFANLTLMRAIVVKKRTVRHFVAGSSVAFRRIYDAYKDKLFVYCLKFTKSTSDAEEVVQQSFIRLWEHRHCVDPSLPLDPYIYRIARNCAFDYLKDVARTAQFKENLTPPPARCYQESASANYEQIAEEAINTLPEKRQVIFRMSYEEGMSPQEIADALRLSVHTVKSQLVKATKTLRLLVLQRAGMCTLFLSLLD